MKIFYDPITGNQIHDVSGKKTMSDIIAEFGLEREVQDPPLAPVQEVVLGEDEAVEIINNVATKFNKKDRQDAADAAKEAEKIAKEAEKVAKKASIIAVLKITEAEFEDLKIALS